MIGTTATVVAIIALTIILILVLVFRPTITASQGGKILAFVAMCALPLFSGWMGASEHLARSKTTQFCTSCHVMQDFGKSLMQDDISAIPAQHFQNNRVPRENACYTCHTDYTMFGDFNSKLRGLRHVYVQYLGKVPASNEVKLYTPYNNRECLHCHSGARNFEEGATHTAEDNRLELIKSNQLSCSSSGCHEVNHNIEGLKDATFWEEGKKE